MTPMIDVVFLLLIFFVWTASFQVAEFLLPTHLLTSAGTTLDTEPDPELLDLERIVVRIVWRGQQPAWELNGLPVENLVILRQKLDSIAKIRSDIPVVLDPDSELPLGDMIDVYDLSRQIGFAKVQFASSMDKSQ